jgi:hypothetical protein
VSESERGIQSEVERGVGARERGGGGMQGKKGREGGREWERGWASHSHFFFMFEEDIFRDRVTFSYFVKWDWDFLYSLVKKNDIVEKKWFSECAFNL